MNRIDKIKKIRKTFGVSFKECIEILDKHDEDLDKALNNYKPPRSQYRSNLKFGSIFSYCHQGRIGVMVDLRCQSDLASRTSTFKNLGHDLCLQLASMTGDTSIDELLAAQYIKDDSKTIQDALDYRSRSLQESIVINRIVFWSLS